MAILPVDEMWGVGRQLTKKLATLGSRTALQLADSNQARTKGNTDAEPDSPS